MSQTAQLGCKSALCYTMYASRRAREVAILVYPRCPRCGGSSAGCAFKPTAMSAIPRCRERPCRRRRLEHPIQTAIHVSSVWYYPRGKGASREGHSRRCRVPGNTTRWQARLPPLFRNGRPAGSSRRQLRPSILHGAATESVMVLATTVRLQHSSTQQTSGGGCRGYRPKDDRRESGKSRARLSILAFSDLMSRVWHRF